MARLYSDETIKRRDVIVSVDWNDIKYAVIHAAMNEVGLDGAPGVNGVEAVLEMEQQTEGSPAYNVKKWAGRVRITYPA